MIKGIQHPFQTAVEAHFEMHKDKGNHETFTSILRNVTTTKTTIKQ